MRRTALRDLASRRRALLPRLALVALVAGALVAAGIVIAPAFAPARSTADRARIVPVVSDLYDAVYSSCARQADLHYEQLYAGVTFASVGRDATPGSGTPSIEDRLTAFENCQARHPLDDSLYRADSVDQRRVLRLWYATNLLPCLRARGFETPPLPSAARFERLAYGAYNPYGAVTPGALSLDDVERLQGDCPPAPAAVQAVASAAPGPIDPSWTYVSGG